MSENYPAIKPYESAGFQVEGVIKKAIKINPAAFLDEIRMYMFID